MELKKTKMHPGAMRIIAQHVEGEFCVAINDLSPDDTIWTIKIKIFELTNVFPSKQALFLKDPAAVANTTAPKDGAEQPKVGVLKFLL